MLKLDAQKQVADKKEEDIILSTLWQSPAFRKRVADRDAKIIYMMAGGEGMGPEPRTEYMLHAGQRVENLLLARDAKAAWGRLEKERIALKDIQNTDSEHPPA